MTRAGRKFNHKARRRETTREGRGVGELPVYSLRRRLEAIGICPAPNLTDRQVMDLARRAGVMSMSVEYPLDVLAARGALHAAGEDPRNSRDRADAGARFAALYWRIYGRPARAQNIGFNAPDLDPAPRATILTAEQRLEMDTARLRRIISAVQRGGRHELAVLIRVAVHCYHPRPVQIVPLTNALRWLVAASC